jgi:radical SAM enzyme (rSAM/lipoprotein system)
MVTEIPFSKKIALNLHRKYKKSSTKIHELNYLLWESTLRCNLNCLHCGSDCKKDASTKDMPIEDFLRAIDQLMPIVNPNKTLIVFTGGEPLLRNDLEQTGQALYDRGFPWGLVTNGLLLTSKRLTSLMNAGLRSITISLDGLEDAHNWLRGNPMSYKNAISAISLLPKTADLRYDVVTCVNQKNFDQIPQIKHMLIQMGVKEWRIFTIFPIGRAKNYPELQLTPEQFKTLFDTIKNIRNEGKIKLNYGCEGFLGRYEGNVRDHLFFCRAGINVASILADGSISACPNLRDNFIQGNIYKDNFADIWNNKYEIFRDRSWTKSGICADCSFYKYCEGNGMHLRSQKTGELLFCHLERIKEGEKVK